MPLIRGTRLGPYAIESPIGAGGMGEVYKATDTRLERTVAIKVLPAHVASDPERKSRFEREAKTVAALSHPHICPVFDVGSENGTNFLVMEYLEGETLADRLAKGALPLKLDQALKYAIEIADALDKAHRQGVTHRDLKPANIMLTKAGAKLLDFGLAKLKPTGPQSDASTQLADALTEQGTILGTFQYMAPEQLEGAEADHRTDIWAFGCVVYEMVTARRPFKGESQASLIGAILKDPPAAMSSLQPTSPRAFERLVSTCLAKDPEERWQSAGDLRRELDWIREQPTETDSDESTPRNQVWLPWGLVAALGIVTIALWVGGSGSSAPRPETVHLTVGVPDGHSLVGRGFSYPLALSRDGHRLAYVANNGTSGTTQLFLRQLNDATVRQVANTEGARYPFFSPDGESVGFWAEGWLQRVPFSAGQPLRITAVPDLNRGAAWGPNDTLIFASVTDGLQRVSLAGGAPEPLVDDGRWPSVLDDGRLLFTTGREIQVLDLDVLEPRKIYVSPEPALQAKVLPSGHLVYGSAGRVIALPIDVDSLAVTGAPTVVLEDVFEGSNGGAAFFDVAANGTVVFVPGSTQHSLVLVDQSGAATPLDDRRAAYRHPSLSPDGNHLAVTIDADPDPSDTWILDIARGSWRRFTLSGHNLDPHWTPDGSGLSFCRGREPLLQRLDGGDPRPLLPAEAVTPLNQCLQSWSPDASSFLFHEIHPERGFDLWLFDGSGSEPRVGEWLVSPFNESQARISPDGRWVVYTSGETGQAEVYVRPLRGDGETVLISSGDGTEGQWRADGRELFYRARGQMMAVDVLEGPNFAIGEPRRLFTDTYDRSGQFNYAAFPDGNRFLMIERDPRGDGRNIELILNWFTELERLVPIP